MSTDPPSTDTERRARLALSFLANPGDAVLGAALRTTPAADILAAATGTDARGEAVLTSFAPEPALIRALGRWRGRLGDVPSTGRLAAWQERGLRLVIPGDDEWPPQLDDLGDVRPVVLWVRGAARLRQACAGSVAVVKFATLLSERREPGVVVPMPTFTPKFTTSLFAPIVIG